MEKILFLNHSISLVILGANHGSQKTALLFAQTLTWFQMGGLIFVQNKSAFKSFVYYLPLTTLRPQLNQGVNPSLYSSKSNGLSARKERLAETWTKDGHNLQTRLAWCGTIIGVTEHLKVTNHTDTCDRFHLKSVLIQIVG